MTCFFPNLTTMTMHQCSACDSKLCLSACCGSKAAAFSSISLPAKEMTFLTSRQTYQASCGSMTCKRTSDTFFLLSESANLGELNQWKNNSSCTWTLGVFLDSGSLPFFPMFPALQLIDFCTVGFRTIDSSSPSHLRSRLLANEIPTKTAFGDFGKLIEV